jgi:hypothetical protein
LQIALYPDAKPPANLGIASGTAIAAKHHETLKKMKITTINLRRYREILARLWKCGRSDLARQMNGTLNSELEVRVRSMDAQTVVAGFRKVANCITADVILASLILGAVQLMRIATRFQVFGYPGLAILCFLGAVAGGIWLLFSTFFQDEKIKKTKQC